MDCSPHFCPDLVSKPWGVGGANEHEKWDTINSIAAESESFVRIKREMREVKYNFILIVLYFQTQKVNEWLY
jgi:hypothetical protein